MKHLFENVLSFAFSWRNALRRENESECERKTIYCLQIYWSVSEITGTGSGGDKTLFFGVRGERRRQRKPEEKRVSETRKKANVGLKVNYCIRFSANVALWMPKFLQPHTPQPPKLECSEWSFIWQKQSNSLIYRLRSTMNGRFYVHL